MLKNIRKTLSYAQLLKFEPKDYQVVLADDPRQLRRAKELHARVFLARGYISESDLEDNGLIGRTEDPYQDHATYFLAEKRIEGEWVVCAAARLIREDTHKAHKSFQTLVHQQISDDVLGRINTVGLSKCLEVSALVKQPGESTITTLLLYRAMWSYSLENDIKFWIMSCDDKLFARIHFLFGSALEQIGTKVFFKGHYVVPSLLDLGQSMKAIQSRKFSPNPAKRLMQTRIRNFFLAELPGK